MAAESFFDRWAKNNAEKKAETASDAAVAKDIAAVPAEPTRVPTIEDVAHLTSQSDFAPFVARGVNEDVKRSALKKLFADPHFNVMDGLDVYIEDFNKFTPMTPAVLAALNHAKALLDPLSHLEKPVMRLLEEPPKTTQTPTEVHAAAENEDNAASAIEPVEDAPAEPGESPVDDKPEPIDQATQSTQTIIASRPDDNPV